MSEVSPRSRYATIRNSQFAIRNHSFLSTGRRPLPHRSITPKTGRRPTSRPAPPRPASAAKIHERHRHQAPQQPPLPPRQGLPIALLRQTPPGVGPGRRGQSRVGAGAGHQADQRHCRRGVPRNPHPKKAEPSQPPQKPPAGRPQQTAAARAPDRDGPPRDEPPPAAERRRSRRRAEPTAPTTGPPPPELPPGACAETVPTVWPPPCQNGDRSPAVRDPGRPRAADHSSDTGSRLSRRSRAARNTMGNNASSIEYTALQSTHSLCQPAYSVEGRSSADQPPPRAR